MKLNEVISMGGFQAMAGPGTFITQQVVQPRTIQADAPEQMGKEYEKVKNRQKEQKKIEVNVYNKKDVDEIPDPYEEGWPEGLEALAKKVKLTFFKLNNEPVAEINPGFTEFEKED
jgi:hypothetical protein